MGLYSCVSPTDRSFLYKTDVRNRKKTNPRLSWVVLDLKACYDHPNSLLVPVINAEVDGTVVRLLRRLPQAQDISLHSISSCANSSS